MALFNKFCQIKSVPNTGAASATTIVFTLPGPASANNGIVGWVGWNTAAGTLISVTDSLGTAYTLGQSLDDTTPGRTHQQFYSANLAAGGALTITATLSGASANRTGQIAEYAHVGAFEAQSIRLQTNPGTSPGAVVTTAAAATTVGGLSWANTEATNATSGTLAPEVGYGAHDIEGLGPEFCTGDSNTFIGSIVISFTHSVVARRITGLLCFKVTSPQITSDPNHKTTNRPDTATFSITATGAVSYQWQDDSSGVFANVSGGSGATTANYTTPATTEAFNGRKYHCVTTDGSANVVNSGNAVLRWAWVKDGVGRRTRGALGICALGVGSTVGSSTLTVVPPARAETLALADSQLAVLTLAGVLADTLALADTQAGSLFFTGALSETLALADSQAGANTVAGALAETLALADSQAGVNTAAGAVAETMALADSQSGVMIGAGAVAETLNLADSENGTITVIASDTLGLADSQAGLLTAAGAVAETLALADSPAAARTTAGAVGETMALTDSQVGGLLLVGLRAETLALADGQTGVLLAAGAIAETLALADSQAGLLIGVAATAETLALADSRAGALTGAAARAETLALADSQDRIRITYGTAADSFSLADTADAIWIGPPPAAYIESLHLADISYSTIADTGVFSHESPWRIGSAIQQAQTRRAGPAMQHDATHGVGLATQRDQARRAGPATQRDATRRVGMATQRPSPARIG